MTKAGTGGGAALLDDERDAPRLLAEDDDSRLRAVPSPPTVCLDLLLRGSRTES